MAVPDQPKDAGPPPVVLWFHGFRADALANALSFIPADAWSEQQAMEWWRDAPGPVAIPLGTGYPAVTAAPVTGI